MLSPFIRQPLELALMLCFAASATAADPYEEIRNRMVDEYIVAEGVKDKRVLTSMRQTPRHEFAPYKLRERAYWDMSLPIGKAQTISPPYMVAFMTEKLDPRPEDKVLEIGTGSGYQAAVLSPLCKDVYTIEIVPILGRRAARTLQRLKYKNVHTRIGDGFKGWPEAAPFDKIIVTCSPEDVPKPLVEQLKEGGRMLIPLGERYQQTLYLMTKKDGKLVAEALAPTVFVPMTGKAEDDRKVQPDPLNPQLVNGGFEKVDKKTGKIANWYYQRQITVSAEGAPEGNRYVSFDNRDPGRGAHALQAFGVDGRKVRGLRVVSVVRGKGIRPGFAKHEVASIVVTFYDDLRATVAHVIVDNWRGSFDWIEMDKRIEVPNRAREALIRIGLHGATGQVSFDDVSIKAIK